ncbi:dienelactone hydrolase family protein [Archangium lipolyticum]|uniref:dienelactone hydrolase family protein n=1 Tax=Archangium lipolyticum TaxID=2970465 RepID=UPI00214A4E07|nr:dienelactone hydrolase family protein [Archangium lipolyticum]
MDDHSNRAGDEEHDVEIKTPAGTADAAFFHPSGNGPWPGVLLWPDAFGLRPAMRDMGRRLAAEGYAVLVPNPFYRTRKAPVFSRPMDFAVPAEREEIMKFVGTLNQDTVFTDGGAFLAWLDQQPQVNKRAKIGVQGYCMGGPLTVRTASLSERVGAGASFHGGGLVTQAPDSPHLLAPKIKAEMLIAVAANDDERDPQAKVKLKEAFDAAKVKNKIEVYNGARHGWCVKDMAGGIYNEAAAEKAWAELLALYKRALV